MAGKDVEIVKNLVVLREGNNGWSQELNLVSWYGKSPVYDLRWWSSDKSSSGKGVTLRGEELLKLYHTLTSLVEKGLLGEEIVCGQQ